MSRDDDYTVEDLLRSIKYLLQEIRDAVCPEEEEEW